MPLDKDHQLFLRVLMNRRIFSEDEFDSLFQEFFDMGSVNKQDVLENIRSANTVAKIDKVTCEVTGNEFYIVFPTSYKKEFVWPNLYSKEQNDFMYKILKAILRSGNGCISKRLVLELDDALNTESTLDSFVANKQLLEIDGNIFLSPVLKHEMEPIFRMKFSDSLKPCYCCMQLVFFGKTCNQCSQKFHKYCLEKFKPSNESSPDIRCPACRSALNL